MLERLARHARTPGAARRCSAAAGAEVFAADPASARVLLGETGEARAWLAGRPAPLAAIADVESALRRAERGGALHPDDILAVTGAAETVWDAARSLRVRAAEAPLLAARLDGAGEPPDWIRSVRATLDPEGNVVDSASPGLRDARTRVRQLGSKLQRRLQTALTDPAIAAHLSDRFVTVRGGRYVLPVRADARSHVPGIVHDASASGTTLFIEPDAAVATNNALREAELEVRRETQRILQELSEAIGACSDELRAGIAALEHVDLAFARGALALEGEAAPVELATAGGHFLPGLRHPLLPPGEVVPNDLRLGDRFQILVLSGPNAGGKTVAMKALGVAILGAHAGLWPCATGDGARVAWTETLLSDIGDAQSVRDQLSTFSAHLRNLAQILEQADAETLVLLDEIGDGTDPGEGAALAQAVLEHLAARGARAVVTTHYNLLKELAAADERFENGSFEFASDTLAPTYRLRMGTPGTSSATAVAARMGIPRGVLDRANELLEGGDRRLERTLATLGESRLALERERREAAQLRAESAAERDALRAKLEHLQARRDRLYDELREELETSFRDAHEQVAAVIRELQRGDRGARDAERARQGLLAIERRERAAGSLEAQRRPPAELRPVDWRRAKPGQRVALARGGEATLLTLPDRRGRVSVQLGSARMWFPAEGVGLPSTPDRADEPRLARVRVERHADGGAPLRPELSLRGMRVDEARTRLAEYLDRAAAEGLPQLRIVHGVGTGALCRAVREDLSDSPYVESFAPGAAEAGGEGITEVTLKI